MLAIVVVVYCVMNWVSILIEFLGFLNVRLYNLYIFVIYGVSQLT